MNYRPCPMKCETLPRSGARICSTWRLRNDRISNVSCLNAAKQPSAGDIKFHLGGRFLPLRDDISSVAYWYQTLPTQPFPPLPARDDLEII